MAGRISILIELSRTLPIVHVSGTSLVVYRAAAYRNLSPVNNAEAIAELAEGADEPMYLACL